MRALEYLLSANSLAAFVLLRVAVVGVVVAILDIAVVALLAVVVADCSSIVTGSAAGAATAQSPAFCLPFSIIRSLLCCCCCCRCCCCFCCQLFRVLFAFLRGSRAVSQ